jgi:hypothetical protein
MVSLDADEWNYIGVAGRDIVLAFDGDAQRKLDVRGPERQLWELLTELGGRVRIAALPDGMGLDDYLFDHSLKDLNALVTGYHDGRGPLPERLCGHCERRIPKSAHPQRLYCNDACRKEAAYFRMLEGEIAQGHMPHSTINSARSQSRILQRRHKETP